MNKILAFIIFVLCVSQPAYSKGEVFRATFATEAPAEISACPSEDIINHIMGFSQQCKTDHPIFDGQDWTYTSSYDSVLASFNVYPTYWFQGMCSSTVGQSRQLGDPSIGTGNDLNCWCRLLRKSDGRYSRFMMAVSFNTSADCTKGCTVACSEGAALMVSQMDTASLFGN